MNFDSHTTCIPTLIPSKPGDTVERHGCGYIADPLWTARPRESAAPSGRPGYQFPADVKGEIERLVDLHLARVERRFT